MTKPDSRRTLVLACGVPLAIMAQAVPAAAQQSITVNQNGSDTVSAINSGDVSLNGWVSNPTVSGTNNSAGVLSAQGANSSYSINDSNYDAAGNAVGTYTAEVSDVRTSGNNSGAVNVRGSINGSSLNGNAISQSIVATGYANTISIKTTGK
ncbi:MAG: hypothetical protein ACKVOL_15280 [Novosphingobium sp.]